MATDSTERVSRYHAAIRAGVEVPEVVAEFWDPDADYYPARKFPEARGCHGRHEVASFLTAYFEAFPIYDWVTRELAAVGDDRVLACIDMRAEGRGSGASVAGELYQCYWLRNGLFCRVEDHLTLKGALHALGLPGDTLEAAGLHGRSGS